MKLKLTQSARYFDLGTSQVCCRTLEPSAPYGAWPGNDKTIRVWEIRDQENIYRKCTREELVRLEAYLGEWKNIEFISHPTLGLVTALVE